MNTASDMSESLLEGSRDRREPQDQKQNGNQANIQPGFFRIETEENMKLLTGQGKAGKKRRIKRGLSRKAVCLVNIM